MLTFVKVARWLHRGSFVRDGVRRLVSELDVLTVSHAHATMLGEQGIVTPDEAAALVAGLEDLRRQVAADEIDWSVELEDVHMNLERRLTDAIGPVGGRLHTARSRNDQVATDFRLALRSRTRRILGARSGALRRSSGSWRSWGYLHPAPLSSEPVAGLSGARERPFPPLGGTPWPVVKRSPLHPPGGTWPVPVRAGARGAPVALSLP